MWQRAFEDSLSQFKNSLPAGQSLLDDLRDLLYKAFGAEGMGWLQDLNGDGQVDVYDVSIILLDNAGARVPKTTAGSAVFAGIDPMAVTSFEVHPIKFVISFPF